MKKNYRIVKKGLTYGILSGLTSTGLLYPSKLEPVHYPNSQKDDQNAIGADMWDAFERVSNEKEELNEKEKSANAE